MKLTITTLTGDKFDVEVNAEDKVKDIKVSNEGQVIKECSMNNGVASSLFCEDLFKTVLAWILYSQGRIQDSP